MIRRARNLFARTKKKARRKISGLLHGMRNNPKLLKNRDFTILSFNCLGGFLYHELGLRMDSPTINLWIPQWDFNRYVRHLEAFTKQGILTLDHMGTAVWDEEKGISTQYPIATLTCDAGAVTIHFNHHTDFETARHDWMRRADRIHYDNIYVVSLYDEEEQTYLDDFMTLPYKNKIILTPKAYPAKYRSILYRFKSRLFREIFVYGIEWWEDPNTGRPHYDEWNYVKFLNRV
jgi:uncharacterized protein (DUF1919 family)